MGLKIGNRQKRFICSFYIVVLVALLINTKHSANADELSLDAVLVKGVTASPDLKIAQQDIAISRNDIKVARADYYPTIKAELDTEYLRDLEKQVSPVVVVGNTLIPSGTRYQNSLGFSLNHTLIDYGIRARRVEYAKADVLSKAAIYDQNIRDLQLKLLDLFTDAWTNYQGIQTQKAILTLAQQGYLMKKRLHLAGTLSKVDVATEAIQVAQAMDDIETYKRQLAQNLLDIGYYTQENYDADTIEIADPEEEKPDLTLTLDLNRTPEARNFDAQLIEKEKEIQVLRRQYLPQVSLYSYYNLYGFDPSRYGSSVQNFSQRTISLGLSVSMPIFDGFKNKASIQKSQLELEKIRLQKTKALLDLKHQADTARDQIDAHMVLLETKAAIIDKTQEKLGMEDRLAAQQLIDKTQAIQDHINRIQKLFESQKVYIQGIIAMKKLKLMEVAL